MESLPDELFSLIFLYLHRFDLLYIFNKLNRRFQQIIEPYIYNINLIEANLSYTHFRLFLKYILPSQGNFIRSLTVNGLQLFELLRSHVHHFVNLESITLKPRLTDRVRSDKLDSCLTQVLRIPTLNQLFIHVDGYIPITFILQYATPNLQTLTLLNSFDFYLFEGIIQQTSYLRRLSINLMSTLELVKLFKIVVNLEELNLSVYKFDDFELIETPNTLEKLHLEIDCCQLKSKQNEKSLHQSNFNTLNKLLDNFRNNLKSLCLIILNAEEEFSDFNKFHNLINNFVHLDTFEYDIRTKYRPDQSFPNVEEFISFDSTYSVYSNRQPQSFDTTFGRVQSHKYYCTSDLTQSQLLTATSLHATDDDFYLPTLFELNDNLKLVNLNKIEIWQSMLNSNPQIGPFLSKIIIISPNLRNLVFQNDTMEGILLLMRQFITSTAISRKIAQVELIVYDHFDNQGQTFCSDMAQIVPNLKSLKLTLYGFNVTNSNRLKTLIKMIRTDFHKLNKLILVDREDVEDRKDNDVKIESYTKILNELRHETEVPLYWSIDYATMGDDIFFFIWT